MDKKWNLQDIKPSEKRRPAPRPVARRVSESEQDLRTPERVESAQQARPGKSSSRPSKKGVFLAALVILAVAVSGVLFTAFASKTSVTVFPRWREPTVNAVFEASRQTSDNGLVYELMTLEAEGDREVAASGQEEVEEQATGQITIYNTSDASQRLITNTRFETTDGLLFRIKDSVVVPAATDGTAGTVAADVFADQAGPEYNVPASTRFSVPGLEGSDAYEAVYAENPTAMSGGHRGPKFIVDEAELSTATEALRTELRDALAGRIGSERPAGFVAFDTAIRYAYQALPAEDVGNGRVKIKEKVTLQLPIFKNEDFAAFLATATVPGYEGQAVRLEDFSTLTFEYAAEPNFAVDVPISFKLLGRPVIVWAYDAEQLKRDLAGGSQTALNTVLGGYPAIEKATATIKPFWKRSFPEDPADIAIVEDLTAE
jgi:hypothetical protein